MSARIPKLSAAQAPALAHHPHHGQGVEIGTVEAPNADSAIRQAIKDYGISDREQQKRLAAYRVG